MEGRAEMSERSFAPQKLTTWIKSPSTELL